MAAYNQNGSQQQGRRRRSGPSIFSVIFLGIILFVFVFPGLARIITAFELLGYGEYYQLSVQTPQLIPLGTTLEDGTEALYGDEFYLLSAYVENNSTYSAYPYADSFSIRVRGTYYYPEPWNEAAAGPFADWNNRELFPAQRGKNMVLLFSLPEVLTDADLIYYSTFADKETVKIEVLLQ